jgi:hypothetical protein
MFYNIGPWNHAMSLKNYGFLLQLMKTAPGAYTVKLITAVIY